jgi:hypothetical protein
LGKLKSHFQIIRECIGQCARHIEEEFEIIFEKTCRDERGKQEGCISQERLGTNPKRYFYVRVL